MAVHMTLKHIPATGSLKDECGLPLSCIIEPLKKLQLANRATHVTAPDTSSIGRCSECYAYANHLCAFLDRAWQCSLCGRHNDYASLRNRRYAGKAGRNRSPELQGDTVDLCCPAEDLDNLPEDPEGEAQQQVVRPICVALVDITGTEDYLELVRCSLLATLEGLPQCALFGLATFSDKIEMYSISENGSLSKRAVPLIEDGDEPTPVPLHHVMPVHEFLAPVGSSKDAISAALEGLQAGGQPEVKGRRGFGSAVKALLRYLGSAVSGAASSAGQALAGAARPLSLEGGRLLTFLAGCPDHGRGAVLHQPQDLQTLQQVPYDAGAMPDSNPYAYLPILSQVSKANDESAKSLAAANGSSAAWVLNPAASAFYDEAGSAAAALGLSVDILVVSARSCGLNAIQALASGSGGVLRLYGSLQHAAMPQDVYRCLVGPRAFRGLLRVRTSPELRVSKAYSPLAPVPEAQNLWQLPACSHHAAVGFDFDYASSAGFSRSKTGRAVLQMALQYSALRPVGRVASHEGPVDGRSAGSQQYDGLLLERRMRIVTAALPIASAPAEVYANADADALVAMLAHKIGLVVTQQGLERGQGLLQDWLVLFVGAYNAHRGLQPKSPQEVDADLAECEALQAVPRLVYGMLRCALLMQRPGQHPDQHVALSHLWGSLPPSELRCALYSTLSSFSDLDSMINRRHSLSNAALETSNAPIFLLDAFTEIFVYYASNCPASIPHTPPQQSLLWRQISTLRAQRTITARVRIVREGADDDEGLRAFRSHLLEEPERRTDGQPGFPGVVAFLDELQTEVWKYMNEVGQQ